MKIGDEVYIHGYIDEIRKDTIIIHNDGGYFGTVQEEISVNPQPKTGHWIMSDDGLYRPICDKCGVHPWKGYVPTVEEATEVFKFCPNCGCRMVEPQERSEE